MKGIIRTAEKIMLEAKAYTGWNFLGAVKGNIFMMRANLINNAGKNIKVIIQVQENDALIQVVGLDESFDKEAVEQIHEKLEFPVEVEIKEGKALIVSYHEPLGVLEHSVKGVFKACIGPMMDLVSQILGE